MAKNAKKSLKNTEKTSKTSKKSTKIGLFSLIILLIIGGVAGYFTSRYVLTKDDIFEVIGDKTITLSLGETYQDEGAIAIAFGKDVSSEIKVETNVDYEKEGTYYIRYTVDNIRYLNIERYRTIIIEAPSEVTNEGN